jgi:hypothetical protein
MTFGQPWGMNPLALSRWPADAELGRSFLSVRGPARGAFPFREPDEQALRFPHDGKTREFHITGWEWKALVEAGQSYDYELDRTYVFDQEISFGEYVNHFFELKKKAAKGSTQRQFAKLMLNSLYGKWSSNPQAYCKYVIDKVGSKPPDGYRLCDRSYPWDFFCRPLADEEQRYYDVSTGAGITGFVRAYLYTHLVQQFGPRFWEHPRLFYVDTDNIKGTGITIPHGSNLGAWDCEFSAVDAAFAGKKLYALKGRDEKGPSTIVRSKGVRLTYDEVLTVARGGAVTSRRDAPCISVRSGTKFIERTIRMTV